MQAGQASDGIKLNWFAKTILAIMLLFLAIFPFGLSVLRISRGYVGYWDMSSLSVMAAIVGLILCVCVACMMMGKKRLKRLQAGGVCIGLFALSMGMRAICAFILRATPVSDFNEGYQYALGNDASLYCLAKYPYLGAYALTLKALYAVFPPTVLSGQMFNAAVLGLVPVFLYLAARTYMDDDRPAIAGAVLYALYPSSVVYSGILSCENVAQMLVALFLWVNACWAKAELGTKKKYVLTIVMGLALGLINWYKQIMLLFIGATAMACFCYQIIPVAYATIKKENDAGKKLIELIAHLVISIIIAVLVSEAGRYAVQMTIVGETVESPFYIGSTLYFGLNPQSNGVWNQEVVGTINNVIEEYPDSEVNRVLLQKIAELYNGDASLAWAVQLNKLDINWCQEGVYYYWTNATEPVVQGTLVGAFLFEILPNLFAISLYALCSIGAILLLINLFANKRSEVRRNQSLFVCIGTIFLFVVMLMLMETQGRYKSNIMPLICCMGGIGLWMLTDYAAKAIRCTQAAVVRKLKK